jgi:hypothetical protein
MGKGDKRHKRRGGDDTDHMDAAPTAPPMPSVTSANNSTSPHSSTPGVAVQVSPRPCCHSRDCPGKEICDPNARVCRKRAKRTTRTIEELKAECEARNIPTKYEFPYKRGNKNQEKNKHSLQHCLRQRPRTQEDLDRKDRLLAAYIARMEENGLSFSTPAEAQAAFASIGVQVDEDSLRRHFENQGGPPSPPPGGPPPPPGGPPPPPGGPPPPPGGPPPPPGDPPGGPSPAPPRMTTRSQAKSQSAPAPELPKQRPFDRKETLSRKKDHVLDEINPKPKKQTKQTPPAAPTSVPAPERRQTRSQASKQFTPPPGVQHPPMKKAKTKSRLEALIEEEEDATPSSHRQTRSQTSNGRTPAPSSASPKKRSMNNDLLQELLQTDLKKKGVTSQKAVKERIGAIKRTRVTAQPVNLGTRHQSKRPKKGITRSVSFDYNDEDSDEDVLQDKSDPLAKRPKSARTAIPENRPKTAPEPEKRKRKSRIPKNAKVDEDENASDASQMLKDISPKFTEGEFIVIDAAGADDDETRLGVPLPDPQPSVNPYEPGYVFAGWFDYADGDHFYFEPLIDAHIYNGRRTNRNRDIARHRVITSRELRNAQFLELMNGRINHVDSIILRKTGVAKTSNGLPQDLIEEIQRAYKWELKRPEDSLEEGSDDFMDNVR